MTEKRKRGRPRLPIWPEMPRPRYELTATQRKRLAASLARSLPEELRDDVGGDPITAHPTTEVAG